MGRAGRPTVVVVERRNSRKRETKLGYCAVTSVPLGLNTGILKTSKNHASNKTELLICMHEGIGYSHHQFPLKRAETFRIFRHAPKLCLVAPPPRCPVLKPLDSLPNRLLGTKCFFCRTKPLPTSAGCGFLKLRLRNKFTN